MGYLSQKKHKIRENIALNCISVICAIMAAILFKYPEFVLFKLNLFHFYCIIILLLIWAIAARKWLPATVVGIACAVCYIQLSISGNIFISDKYDGEHFHHIEYTNNLQIDDAKGKGGLFFGKQEFAQYAIISGMSPLLIVKVDLGELPHEKYAVILKELHKFVVKQDMPVVMMGNFNMPSWAKVFRRFSEYSGLKVKNRIIFANAKEQGFFAIPHFYILGFGHLGIKNLQVDKKKMSFDVEYDII